MSSYQEQPFFVQKMIDDIIKMEGGYVDNPSDSGGKTKYGITEHTARAYGYEGSMEELSLELAQEIYLFDYYLQPKFDLVAEVSELLAKEMMDSGVNTGQRTPIKWFQRLLNVSNLRQKLYSDIEVDGYLGKATMGAYVNLCKHRGSATAENYIFNGLNSLQQVHYIELAEEREKDEEFVFGQIVNRVEYQPF